MAISMRTTQARAGQSPWLLLLLLLTLASSTPAASAPATIPPALALARNAVGASAGTGITALESLECGPGPTALNASTPNVLIIGDAISSGPSSTPTDPTGGYSGNVATILGGPFAQFYTKSLAGGLATVQHLGSADTGSVQAAACIPTWLGGLRWDLVVVNVGLVDCTGVPLDVDQYQENVMKVMRAAWAAGGNAIFVATTPTSNSTPGVNHTCIKHANTAANSVVEQILNGGSPHISFLDLYAGVTAFCGSNYSSCPIQLDATPSFATTWTAPWPVSASGAPLQSMPRPSGQQFTALLVAQAIQRAVPVAKIQPPVNTSVDPPPRHAPTSLLGDGETRGGSPCGLPPAPLNTSIPNMLIIGDSVSDSGSGYGPLVRQLLEQVPNIPGVYGHVDPHSAGPLAIVQHNGGWAPAPGSNEQASSSANGVKCIAEWLGNPANFKWDGRLTPCSALTSDLHSVWLSTPSKSLDLALSVGRFALVRHPGSLKTLHVFQSVESCITWTDLEFL
jgi:hypothetical protein